MKYPVFYSFHYDKDVFRVQQIRQMGVLEGDEPVSPNAWETIKKTPSSISTWIDESLKYKRCAVVLIGSETHSRPWVKYEIAHAARMGKPIIGINIHNLKCPRDGYGVLGKSPFEGLNLVRNGLAYNPKVYNPSADDAYKSISQNINEWVGRAIAE